MRVLICGGGVIGASIAYFLARRGARPLVIERTAVAGAASGKSGGFLALDWCDGTPLEQLARRSFALHAALPSEIAANWGYRPMTTFGGFAPVEARGAPARNWLADEVTLNRRLGSPQTTAKLSQGVAIDVDDQDSSGVSFGHRFQQLEPESRFCWERAWENENTLLPGAHPSLLGRAPGIIN